MVKLFLTDVDGTLTDGGRYLNSEGQEMKKFYIPDGMGLVTIQKMGVKTGIITAEKGKLVEMRASQLKMNSLVMDCHDKLAAAHLLCAENNCTLADVAFIGDDLNDHELLSSVGRAGCPSDAQNIIKSIPGIYVSKNRGGEGAVRDFINFIFGEENLLKSWKVK